MRFFSDNPALALYKVTNTYIRLELLTGASEQRLPITNH